MGTAFLGKQELGRSNADSSKKRFIKTVDKLQMVFVSEGMLPKASGAREIQRSVARQSCDSSLVKVLCWSLPRLLKKKF